MDQHQATTSGLDPEFAALVAAVDASFAARAEAERTATVRLAAGDTSDLLPGLDPERAVRAARQRLGL